VLWLVALAGFVITVVTLLSAVIPPPDVESAVVFEAKLWGGLIGFAIIGYTVYRSYRAAP
jgi:uncharacterized membrane protein